MKRVFAILGFVLLSIAPAAAFPAPPRDIDFKVYRDGEELGHHRVRFTEDGPRTVANVDIEFAVTFAGIRVFHYLHRSHEVWESGRLIALSSTTSDDGDEAAVKVRRSGDLLAIEGTDFTGPAPGELVPASYWFPGAMEQRQFLDTTVGRVFPATIQKIGVETVEAAGGSVAATHYTLTEQITMHIWYDADGNWVKSSFDVRGSTIDYVLQPSDYRQTALR